MHVIASDTTVLQAADHLAAHDPVLGAVISRTSVCTIRPHTRYFERLVDSIIGQQLSVKAAETIKLRFRGLFGGTMPQPAEILAKDFDELRSAGLSKTKTAYIRDLAEHVVDGRLRFEDFVSLGNAEIIKELVAVKGIGEWTAHMFLMFGLGRLDVLAAGDLGIRNGIRTLYGLDQPPTPAEIIGIADTNGWHPYESVACWYVWRSLDNEPV